MKNLILIFIFGLLIGCKVKDAGSKNDKGFVLESSCPANGTCEMSIKPEQSYKFSKDDAGVLFSVYEENLTTDVLVVSYAEESQQKLQDDFYEEKILITLPKKYSNGIFKDKELEKFNIGYGRFCYCKGLAGYYPVNNGTLEIIENKLNLQFTVGGPQKLKIITITLP